MMLLSRHWARLVSPALRWKHVVIHQNSKVGAPPIIKRLCLEPSLVRMHRVLEGTAQYSSDARSNSPETQDDASEEKQKRRTHRQTMEDLEGVVQLVRDDGCLDVVAIDIRSRTPQCDFYVIATCRASRHMTAVAETINKQFKDRRRKGESLIVEGDAESQWMIVNMSDIQVHLLESQMRQRLELEKLWTLGPDDDQLRDLIDSRPELFI